MTVCVSPSSNRTCGFPASGSRRLFTGLLHELRHFSACSWLAGRAFAAISELPLPSPAAWGVSIPCGPSPGSLSAWNASAQSAPPSLHPDFRGFLALLRRTPTPARAVSASPISGVAPHVEALASPEQSPGLSRSPFPTCHLRRHRQSDRQTPTVVRSAPDRLRRNSSGSSLWL